MRQFISCEFIYSLMYSTNGCRTKIKLSSPFTALHCIQSKRSRYTRPRRAQRGSRGIALLILDLGARRGWVVSTTSRPLYPRERPVTHCTGGLVGLRAGLDVCEKSRPTGIRSPDRPARSQSLYRLELPGPLHTI
jgi:hypothetical protein